MTKKDLGYIVVEYVDGSDKGYVFDNLLDTLEEAEKIIEEAENFNENNGYDGQVDYKIFKLEATKAK